MTDDFEPREITEHQDDTEDGVAVGADEAPDVREGKVPEPDEQEK